MQNTKDRILQYLLENMAWTGDHVISKDLSIDRNNVVNDIMEIEQRRPDFIMTRGGYGDNAIYGMIRPSAKNKVKLFLDGGGFTSIDQAILVEEIQERQLKQLSMEQVLLQIQDLKAQASWRRKQEIWQWIVIGLSLIPLLYAAVKWVASLLK